MCRAPSDLLARRGRFLGSRRGFFLIRPSVGYIFSRTFCCADAAVDAFCRIDHSEAPLISIACTGQLFTQRVHPMHPTEQTLLTSGPLRGELQETLTFDFLGTSTNTSLGQFSTQAPHPTHFSASTTARPFFIVMAWKAQTLTHVPRPMHPYAHEVGPFPGTRRAALQSYSPK